MDEHQHDLSVEEPLSFEGHILNRKARVTAVMQRELVSDRVVPVEPALESLDAVYHDTEVDRVQAADAGVAKQRYVFDAVPRLHVPPTCRVMQQVRELLQGHRCGGEVAHRLPRPEYIAESRLDGLRRLGQDDPVIDGKDVMDERLPPLPALALRSEEFADRANKYAWEYVGKSSVGTGLCEIIRRLQDLADGVLRARRHRTHRRDGILQLRRDIGDGFAWGEQVLNHGGLQGVGTDFDRAGEECGTGQSSRQPRDPPRRCEEGGSHRGRGSSPPAPAASQLLE